MIRSILAFSLLCSLAAAPQEGSLIASMDDVKVTPPEKGGETVAGHRQGMKFSFDDKCKTAF
jgi:hypothetical protein